MPSFDIVSELNWHEVTNAVDQANREIVTRYDFKGVDASFTIKDKQAIVLEAKAEMQLKQMVDMISQKLVNRGIDLKCLDRGKIVESNLRATQELKLKEGIDAAEAKKLVKLIKDSKIKVQAQIQGEQLRVTGKKRDDLQQVMQLVRSSELELPVQFNNFRD
ncbi:YajQ family cyclic di-GMP-binding protein [Maribrevibacterium harenarium]|uniref:Nucleotide-binding protein FJM67_00515 n=1 Tax=Maribrevibacterium harenarium TaxID=2589817 RepID=A0A501X588_9GAMM|nr:YajQ family cyclic di-GMP-binding protein [Maribrevibacterium harenarium]TPE55567.1 YajQ family cyclic di-GMP-binding protein [Maribrevibacterium harenarium]